MWSHLEAVEKLGTKICVSAENKLQRPYGSKSWSALPAESFTWIAFEPTAINKKNPTTPNPKLHLHKTTHSQVLHFLESEVKTVFRSGAAKISRRFATDSNWHIHVVDMYCLYCSWWEKHYCLLRTFFTQLVQPTFKYISFCAFHYPIIKSNSG